MPIEQYRSAIDNATFVAAAIEKEECSVCPTVYNPLSVVTNSKGKQRSVLDLRYFCKTVSLRMKG